MANILILIAVGAIFFWGYGILEKYNNGQMNESHEINPPPLPPKRMRVNRTQVPKDAAGISEMSPGASNARYRHNCGPHGLKPIQFPCCPYDKQRNIVGERQRIFWDKNANCYRCSRGHRFKSNGKIF